jgi:hypothetical protein
VKNEDNLTWIGGSMLPFGAPGMDLAGGALDRGGGGSAGAVTRSWLITKDCFSCKALSRATILTPAALSLLYSPLHVDNIVTWICFGQLSRLYYTCS